MSEDQAPTDGRGGPIEGDNSRLDVLAADPATRELSAGEIDTLFEVLADGQRRRILAHLAETDSGVATFADLIEDVTDAEQPDDESRERVAINLHHRHLPKLADEGFLEYDTRSETVRYREDSAVEDWLEFVTE